jgi:hypothetical protein
MSTEGTARRAPRASSAREQAVAMKVLAVDEERALALCGTDHGSRLSVEIAPLLPVAVGEVLLVQAGRALARA